MSKYCMTFLAVLVFMVPAIVCAEFAPQFKESSKGAANLSKSAPTHGKVYKSKTTMEKTAAHKNISKNKQVMERKTSQRQQAHKVLQGTVNE